VSCFAAVLDYIGDRDLVNHAIEINLSRDTTEIEKYEIPPVDAADDQLPSELARKTPYRSIARRSP
jgi:hypothetical protein